MSVLDYNGNKLECVMELGWILYARSPCRVPSNACFADIGVTRWRSRLRHCAISRKAAGSIPDEVFFGFFIDLILPAALWLWGLLSL
jgi:hypothetical protein